MSWVRRKAIKKELNPAIIAVILVVVLGAIGIFGWTKVNDRPVDGAEALPSGMRDRIKASQNRSQPPPSQ